MKTSEMGLGDYEFDLTLENADGFIVNIGRVVCMGGVACVRVGGVVRVKKVKGDLIELLITSGEGGDFEAMLLELVFDAGSDGELEGCDL
jgi:hypothetical protein